jgi:REP element-mobilizing transposase RayT
MAMFSAACHPEKKMRHSRIKPSEDTFMHVYNRSVGTTSDRPFGRREKEEFRRRLKRLCELYVIEVLSVQVMSNHFHLILHVPGQPPSNEEAAERHKRFYGLKRRMSVSSEKCTKLADKLRDISEFMRELQQPFSRWFNSTRPVRRRGSLWAGRFKSTILETGLAVWKCWLYVEMNPVRAYMVSNPADYRFCTFGEWSGRGRHPFERTLEKYVLPWLGNLLQVDSLQGVYDRMKCEFARLRAVEQRQTEQQIEATVAVAAEKEKFVTRLDRRVRYWVDGLVIGSDLFVRKTAGRSLTRINVKKRRLVRALSPDSEKKPPLYSFKQLRVLIE